MPADRSLGDASPSAPDKRRRPRNSGFHPVGEVPLLEALSAEMAAMVTTSGVRCCWGPWKAAEVPSIARVCTCAHTCAHVGGVGEGAESVPVRTVCSVVTFCITSELAQKYCLQACWGKKYCPGVWPRRPEASAPSPGVRSSCAPSGSPAPSVTLKPVVKALESRLPLLSLPFSPAI